MYCPNCGAESTPGFKYCKRCGGNLTETAQMTQMTLPPVMPPRNTFVALVFAAATVAITLGGLGIVFGLVLDLIGPWRAGPDRPIHDASFIIAGMMVLFGSATVAFIAFMLIKIFARIMGLPQASDNHARIKKPAPSDYQPVQLPASSAGISSVTEHTTRNFRPAVYDEAKARE